MINIVAALTKSGVIGRNNTLPWNIPEEFQHFQSLIAGGTIIVGRKTWESINNPDFSSKKYIVVSKSLDKLKKAKVCRTFTEALNLAKLSEQEIHVCGGKKIYDEAFSVADKLLISYIKKEYDGDTYFPTFNKEDWEVEDKKDFKEFEYVVYRRKKCC